MTERDSGRDRHQHRRLPDAVHDGLPHGHDGAGACGIDLGTSERTRALQEAARKTLAMVAQATTERGKVSRYDIPVMLADGGILLFNSRTRSLSLLNGGEAGTYRQMASEPGFVISAVQDRPLLEVLARGGNVVDENADELAQVQSDYEAARHGTANLTLTIAPTMACNFACGYCFQGLSKPTRKMGPDVQDAIIAFVKARQGLRSLSVVWYGGEPLMGKDSIYKLSDSLIAWCDKHGIAYNAGIVTNAWFLTAETAQQLYSRRISWAQVTVDGDRETHDTMRPLTSGHGTFDRIVENVAATLDATPLGISVRVNVGRRNVANADALLDNFAALDLARRGRFNIYFAPIEASTPESGTAFEEKLERLEFNRAVLALEEKARRLGLASIMQASPGFSGMCVAAADGGFVIAGNGDVHKCWETAHDPSKRTGTIFEPAKLAESVNASLWRQWTPFDNDTCRSCKILPMCGGHCAHRFVYGGPDQTALPCPSWKWNTAEYVFSRAKDLGVLSQEQWLPEQSTAIAMQSGARHSTETLRGTQARVLEKVSALHDRPITREMILDGEPALEP